MPEILNLPLMAEAVLEAQAWRTPALPVVTQSDTVCTSHLLLEKIKLHEELGIHLWKSISSSIPLPSSISGRRLDQVVLHPDGIRGFPVVLQQINKILNYPLTLTGQAKPGEMLYYTTPSSTFVLPGLGTVHQQTFFSSSFLACFP